VCRLAKSNHVKNNHTWVKNTYYIRQINGMTLADIMFYANCVSDSVCLCVRVGLVRVCVQMADSSCGRLAAALLIKGGPKLHNFWYALTLQKLTDFHNYFTVRIRRKFIIILSLKVPHCKLIRLTVCRALATHSFTSQRLCTLWAPSSSLENVS